jgi:hypothetical protein
VTTHLDRGDLAYIVDALLDAAEARRKRGGNLQERIAEHLEDLAIRLDNCRADRIGVRQ